MNWKLKISNASDNDNVTYSQARDTRHRRMQEVNSLCTDSRPIRANTVLCPSSSNDSAKCYVRYFQFSEWRHFHIMEQIGHNQRRCVFRPVRQVDAPVGRQKTLFGRVCQTAAPWVKSDVYDCLVICCYT